MDCILGKKPGPENKARCPAACAQRLFAGPLLHLRSVHSYHPGARHTRLFAAVAIAVAVFLLLLSLIFWKERMLFADAPHILFRIINLGTLQVQEQRWGSFITQGLPLLASKGGLSLKSVTVLYSASFNLFYLAVVLLLVFRHRRADLALMFALYLILFTTETFYWPNNEVHQGVGWLMLCFGEYCRQLRRGSAPALRVIVFLLLVTLAIWTHPLVMFPAGFLWAAFLLEEKGNAVKGEKILLSIFLFALAAWRYKWSRGHGYDSGKLEAIDGLKFSAVPKAFTSEMAVGFARSALLYYAVFTAFFVLGIWGLLKSGRRAAPALTILYALGFFFIVAHTHPGFDRFYIESEWMPLGFAAALPLVWYALPRLRTRVALVLLCAGIGLQAFWILRAAAPFSARITFLQNKLLVMERAGAYKAFFPEPDEKLRKELRLCWGAQVESILYTALDGERPQRTFAFLPSEQIDSAINTLGQRSLRSTFEIWPVSRLNARYFLVDTTQEYQSLR